nr:MAG TPA: major tail protein [Caudoviricetes sp.]
MSKEGKTGVSANTPKNIMFGAGTIHKGLKYAGSSWNFDDTIIGATSGGSKLSIVPEITNIEVDGALVKTKGLTVKTGETATMEINFIELTKDIIKAATIGADGTSDDASNYDVIESKANISAGDYWENIAFVGKTLDGKNIIAIMDNALCTSGFEQEGKNKEGAVGKYTFECHAELSSDLDTLPWHIYYPKAS